MTMKRTLLAVLSAAAALLLLPSALAQATPEQDDALFDVMRDVGIALYSRAPVQAMGACAELYSGTDPDVLVGWILDGNQDWNVEQARAFVVAAVGIYCPDLLLAAGPVQGQLRRI
jgi:hypothetical protein